MLIKRFPTICLWCINMLLMSSCITDKALSVADSVAAEDPSLVLVHSGSTVKFKTSVSFQNAQISGILIVKNQNDTIRGAFVNEFGIKAFTFFATEKEGALLTQIKALNKWYIRKTVLSDLSFIFFPEGQCRWVESLGELKKTAKIERAVKGKTTGELTIVNDTLVTMVNNKRNITYQLTMIK